MNLNKILNYTRDTYNPISAKSELYIYDDNGLVVADTAEARLRVSGGAGGGGSGVILMSSNGSKFYNAVWKSKDPNLVTYNGDGIVKYGTPIITGWPFYTQEYVGSFK